jgi:hypothetical protein
MESKVSTSSGRKESVETRTGAIAIGNNQCKETRCDNKRAAKTVETGGRRLEKKGTLDVQVLLWWLRFPFKSWNV